MTAAEFAATFSSPTHESPASYIVTIRSDRASYSATFRSRAEAQRHAESYSAEGLRVEIKEIP